MEILSAGRSFETSSLGFAFRLNTSASIVDKLSYAIIEMQSESAALDNLEKSYMEVPQVKSLLSGPPSLFRIYDCYYVSRVDRVYKWAALPVWLDLFALSFLFWVCKCYSKLGWVDRISKGFAVSFHSTHRSSFPQHNSSKSIVHLQSLLWLGYQIAKGVFFCSCCRARH